MAKNLKRGELRLGVPGEIPTKTPGLYKVPELRT